MLRIQAAETLLSSACAPVSAGAGAVSTPHGGVTAPNMGGTAAPGGAQQPCEAQTGPGSLGFGLRGRRCQGQGMVLMQEKRLKAAALAGTGAGIPGRYRDGLTRVLASWGGIATG